MVESEGNGRMCTTLPEVLISVMGIEKVIPTWQDLEVYPAAAAALLHRRADEPLHVAVDRGLRGRRARASFTSCCSTTAAPTCSPTRSGARRCNCIRCSACLNVCPVYERTGGHAYGSTYPGPIGAILTPMLSGMTAAGLAALRLEPVRRLLRGLPGQDQHPRGARPPAPGGGRPGIARVRRARAGGPRARRDAGDGPGVRQPPAVRGGAARRPAGAVAAGPRRHDPPPARAAVGLDLGPRPAAPSRRRASATGGGERARERRAATRSWAASAAPLDDVPAPERAADVAGGPRLSPRRRAHPRAARRALLAERVARLRAPRCARVAAAELGDAVTRGVRRAGAAPASSSRPACRPAGVRAASSSIEDAELSAAELDRVDGAVTGCAAAIAETGTLVLDGSPICGRRALTLVPDHHICVVLAGQIVELVPEAIAAVAPAVRERAPADHAGLRAVGELGHRARARRGRPRAPRPAGADRDLTRAPATYANVNCGCRGGRFRRGWWPGARRLATFLGAVSEFAYHWSARLGCGALLADGLGRFSLSSRQYLPSSRQQRNA